MLYLRASYPIFRIGSTIPCGQQQAEPIMQIVLEVIRDSTASTSTCKVIGFSGATNTFIPKYLQALLKEGCPQIPMTISGSVIPLTSFAH